MHPLKVIVALLFAVSGAPCALSQALSDYSMEVLRSESLGKNIALKIALPTDYARSGKRHPVVYALDGYMAGEIARQSVERAMRDRASETPILVCIDIDVSSKDAWFQERSFILTPTKSNFYEAFGVKESWTGGAAQFKAALEREIIPRIEEKVRASPSRTLMGHSFGGLFGLYLLFTAPDLFDRYVLSSPSVPWDDRVIFKFESRFAKRGAPLPKTVFMSVGSLENIPEDMMVSHIAELGEQMKLRKYQGLKIQTVVLDGKDHDAAHPIAFADGLRHVFAQSGRVAK